jgi:2-haloacid dehalogenase
VFEGNKLLTVVLLKSKKILQQKTSVEALVFDVYGTLFDLNTFTIECDKLSHGKGREILELVEQKQLEYVLTRSLVNRYRDFASITRGAIKFALQKMRLSTSENRIERLYSVFLRLEPFDDVENTLNDLDQINAKVVLFSNGTQEMLDKVVEHAGLSLLSEEVVSAEGAKAYKPDPKAYQHVLNHLEIFEKNKVFYVSGNTWDVAGAKAFGFKVGWVNRTKQHSFDEDLYELRPEYEFSSVGEITKLLMGVGPPSPEL